ncbi:cyclic peptide export ABC transporter [Ekhidna sp.]|uniref:cyclic peptide export ABC transporter n=1 Tax=Ekhidna sp. TaxID=2608089 RepID=UPI003C7E6975
MVVIRILIKSSLKLFTIALIASILTGFTSTMVIKSIHQAIQDDNFQLTSFLIEFGLFWIAYGALSIVASYAVSKLMQRIIHQLRIEMSRKIIQAPYEEIEFNQTNLLPILSGDIDKIATHIRTLPAVTTGLATVIGILGYMVWYSPILSLATIFLFSLIIVISKVALPLIRKYAFSARSHLNNLFTHFEGLILGIKELSLNKNFSKSFIDDHVIPTSKTQMKYYLKESVVAAIFNRSTDLVLLLGMGALVVIIFQTGFVTLEFFGKYLTLVLFTLAPLSSATGFLRSLKNIEASFQHIKQVGISLEPSFQYDEEIMNQKWDSSKPLVRLNQVEHTYYHADEDEHFKLGPIDLEIMNGESVFIVGGNGSGKTTLAKIILGLYKAKGGSIEYREVPVENENLSFYRSRYSAVFTDSYVFKELDHIDPDFLEAKGQELIDMLELTKKVKIENRSFTTKSLSEGQKKRLSLISSILEDKEIYLFDEWAANQDPYFKDIFYNKIIPFLKEKGKTLIVITHDDRYFGLSDHLLKLRDGKLQKEEQ